MKALALLLCFAVPAAAQDGGTEAPRAKFYPVAGESRLTQPGDAPITLPPGYFLTELSFQILDREMKRLQDGARVAADDKKGFDIPVQGWLLGMSATALLTALIVFGVGWYLRGKP